MGGLGNARLKKSVFPVPNFHRKKGQSTRVIATIVLFKNDESQIGQKIKFFVYQASLLNKFLTLHTKPHNVQKITS